MLSQLVTLNTGCLKIQPISEPECPPQWLAVSRGSFPLTTRLSSTFWSEENAAKVMLKS